MPGVSRRWKRERLQERTLEAEDCTPWFGWQSSVEPQLGIHSATCLTQSQLPCSSRCEKLDYFLHE